MDTPADARENNVDDDLQNTTNGLNEPKRMILRTRNHLSPNSKPANVEEQIIQKRGRRVFTKPTPCTPPPSRKRRADDSTVDLPRPQESPFTKCLRGLLSPKRGVDPSSHSSASSSSSRLLSTDDLPSKKFYYSPNPPYQLRSMDVSTRSSIGTSSSGEFNDSGIGLSPEISLSNTTTNNNNSDCSTIIDTSISSSKSSSKTTAAKKSDTISSKLSTKTTSTTARRINGVRRRFRF